MFDGAFFTSTCLEAFIPLLMLTILFWSIILPKARSVSHQVAENIVSSLKIDPCNRWLKMALDNLMMTHSSVKRAESKSPESFIFAANVAIVLFIGLVTLLIPFFFHVPAKQVLYIFLEIIAMYVLIAIGELFFIFYVAFEYVPGKHEVLQRDMLNQIADACFDGKPPPLNEPLYKQCSAQGSAA